jgi:hypothetical protein
LADKYKEKYGHVNVSRKTDNKSLFNWCTNIKSARKNPETCKRKLTQERIAALDAIGFEWRSEKINPFTSFQDRVKAMSEYKEINGHLNVTSKANKSLNDWCQNIRNARNKPGEGTMKLTQELIALLDAIGFDWNPIRGQRGNNFQDRVAALREYKVKNGHINVIQKDDKSLFTWCTNIRSARRGKLGMKLTTDGIAALDAIGFDWRSETTALSASSRPKRNFQDHVNNLKAYKTQHGHINVKRTEDKSLFDWCSNIRRARNKPGEGKLKLTADRIAALDAIGFDWRSEGLSRNCQKQISFQDRVDALREYKKETGHLSITQKDDKSLFNWCSNIRSARKGKLGLKLTANRIAALDAIGFDWRSETSSRTRNKTISFQDRVKAMSEYKEINGHLNVTFKANKSLNDWCQNIRNARNKPGEGTMKLTQERIEALDAIGFDWRLSKSVLQPFDSLGDDADNAPGKSEEKKILFWIVNTLEMAFIMIILNMSEFQTHQLLSRKSVLIV